MAVESSYMAWWISPGAAAWFCYFLLLNVLVGAIAVTSSRGELPSRRRRLCRNASSMVLDRLRSFSVFSFDNPTEGRSWYYRSPEADNVQVSLAQELSLQSHTVPVSPSSSPQPPPAAAVAVATTSPVRRPAKVVGLANAKPNRRRSHAYAEAADGKAELNARAEQFIRQFRQELRL